VLALSRFAAAFASAIQAKRRLNESGQRYVPLDTAVALAASEIDDMMIKNAGPELRRSQVLDVEELSQRFV
jgi:hypothetical protein